MSKINRRAYSGSNLLLGTALAAVLAAAPGAAQGPTQPPGAAPSATAESANNNPAAIARMDTPSDTTADQKEIVVTGTSIRGVPPTGSNLIQLGAQAVIDTGASTTQELLATIPQLGSFNTAPRPDAHSNGFLSTAPNIRGLGQAQTLVLVNGHRIVGAGHLQNISDPSIVPPSMIQRVEVVADGASSVYGSDGIAGVVNVITLREYQGAGASFRYGAGDGYNLLNTNAVIGSKWDGGGIVGSVEYSRNSRLQGFDRDYVTTDFSSRGAQDLRSQNNCVPGFFRLQSATGAATGDYITAGTGARNERCDVSQYTDLYPKYERLSFFASGHQELSDNIDIYFDAFHSTTKSNAYLGPAGSSGTITRANPFFPTAQVNALPNGTAIQAITAYYRVSEIDGVRLRDRQSQEVYGGTTGIDVGLGQFKWSTYLTGSHSRTDLHEGSFSPTFNSAALSGTTLTTALDPFGGRTDPAVKVGIADYEQFFGSKQYLWEINTKVDGPIFSLPGGEVKVAVGGVYRKEYYNGKNTLSRIGFEEGLGQQIGRRTVYSAFGELFIPLFGADNATTLFRSLDISLSARYDHYNDFGQTTNPKIGVNWRPIESIAFRGSYGTSFHAPALPDLFGPDTRAGYGTGGQNPAGVTPLRTGNIFIAGGNPNLDAEKATTWSLGSDFTPSFLPGFKAGLTYYNIDFKGRIAFPTQFGNFFYLLPQVSRYFIDNITCPGGVPYPIPNTQGLQCTSNPIDPQKVFAAIQGLRLQNFPKPVLTPADIPPVYIITDLRRVNLSQIKTSGLDFDVSYRWSMGATQIAAQLQGNRILRYNQQAVPGAPFVSQFDFGQAKFKARASLSAIHGPITAVAAVNYSDKYKSQYVALSGTATTQAVETVGSFTTVELHLGYKLADFGPLSSAELTVDVDNLLDQDPPELRSGSGYGQGNVLGRVITGGLRVKF